MTATPFPVCLVVQTLMARAQDTNMEKWWLCINYCPIDHSKETLNTISNTKYCPSTTPEKITLHAAIARRKGVLITSCMNLLQTARISLLSVALNIITCFSWGVLRKISWTSLLMSETSLKDYDAFISRCQNKEFIFFPMV